MKIAFVFNQKRDSSVEQAEFDTPETIASITSALASGGHEVVPVEMTADGPKTEMSMKWARRLAELRPDIIFNTAEGYVGIGRESLGPTVFEQLKLPYVGSGPYGCFLTLDKFLTKQMVSARKVPVVEGYFVSSADDLGTIARECVYPAFVKPNFEGSSKGITGRSLCREADELLAYAAELLKEFPSGILIERFIPGRDVSVPFVTGLGDGGVLEPLEYVFDSAQAGKETSVYDYDLKNFHDDAVSVRCPAQIEPSVRQQVIEMMQRVVPAVGVLDFGRADFRVTPDGEVFFLEVNALPSLQPGAGLFEAAKRLGLSYEQTILKILDAATTRLKVGERISKAPRRVLAQKNPRVALVYNLKRKGRTDHDFEAEAEFDSQATVDAIHRALEAQCGPVVPLEATAQLGEGLREHRIDVVFNIAEGSNKRAREAQVPALCDLLGIEHTGSDATCLAITLDKAITKRLLAQDGISTPNFRLFQGQKNFAAELKYPVIVKPNHEGTSKGIGEKSVVSSATELHDVVWSQWRQYREPILCEEYIVGREFTIGLLGNSALKILGPLEIAFKSGAGQYPVYSFEAKNVPNENNPYFQLECPVSLGRELDRKIAASARKIFRSLGCRDVARIDFRVDAQNQLHFLEVNPLPGLSPGFSDLCILALRAGMSYEQLIRRILTPALQRWRQMARAKPL